MPEFFLRLVFIHSKLQIAQGVGGLQMNTGTRGYLAFAKFVGARIKERRLLMGMSQDVLAESCGIFRTYLSRIENGSANPTLPVLAALSTSLNMKLHDLLRGQMTA